MFYKIYTKPGESLKKSKKRKEINSDVGEIEVNDEIKKEFKMNIERQFMEYNNCMKTDSKKEAIANRINEREMVVQRGCNPFLSQNNYINDLMNQEKYIRQNNNLNTQQE